MAGEAVEVPEIFDNKRKLDDVDNISLDLNVKTAPDVAQTADDEDDVGVSDAKRLRIDDEVNGLATENGFESRKCDEVDVHDSRELKTIVCGNDTEELFVAASEIESNERAVEEGILDKIGMPSEPSEEGINEQPDHELVDAQKLTALNPSMFGDTVLPEVGEQKKNYLEVSENPDNVEINDEPTDEVNYKQPGVYNPEIQNAQKPTSEDASKLCNSDLHGEEKQKEASLETSGQGTFFMEDQLQCQQQELTYETVSRKIDIPNNKVGVLIGKAGDTIRFLQHNSGSKIQITKNADTDPNSITRRVEIIGPLECVNKAEKLIKDVIAEADAGGSPSLVARGFTSAPAIGGGEQIEMHVPSDKVGLIIGKGGETIRSLQTKSGARIQLIPHDSSEDESKERMVRVSGDVRQIETATNMLKDVMNQPVGPSSNSHKQAHRPRSGPTSASRQGQGYRGSHSGQGQQTGRYNQHPYHNNSSQYPYGTYPSQQQTPPTRAPYGGTGWEQRPQGPRPDSGYGYYGGPGSGPQPNSYPGFFPARSSSPAMGPPPSYPNYNYGPPGPYSQHQPQAYGATGYEDPKYGNPAQMQPPPYMQGGAGGYPYPNPYPYPSQQPYARPQSYPAGYPPSQTAPTQQTPYPYAASTNPMARPYPANFPGPTAGDPYNQPAVSQAYVADPSQPPVSGYGQAGGHPGYGQGPQGNYGSYPVAQQQQPQQQYYGEQQQQGGVPAAAAPVSTNPNPGYVGYQVGADPGYSANPGYSAAPPSGQQVYAQPVQAQMPTQMPAQMGYDQSVPPPAGGGAMYGSSGQVGGS